MRLGVVGAIALLAGAVVAPADAGVPGPPVAGIGSVLPLGQITERYGFFPEFYADKTTVVPAGVTNVGGTPPVGTPLKLQLCIDNIPQCGVVASTQPNPGAPASFPDNFPGEAFYFSGTAVVGGTTLLVAQEATTLPPPLTDGSQAVFGRLRIRNIGSDLIPNAWYRFTYPYGQVDLQAGPPGSARPINFTNDVGCGPVVLAIGPLCDPAAGTFAASNASNIGPNFLTNTTAAANAGFVGDGVTPAAVSGSVFTPTPVSINAQPPVITIAAATVHGSTQDGNGDVTITYTPTAVDDVDGPEPAPTCVPASGFLVKAAGPPLSAPVNVTCSSTDQAGNLATRIFHFTVPDTTKPVITPPASAVAVTGPPDSTSFAVNFTPTAHDAVDGDIALGAKFSCAPTSGATFPSDLEPGSTGVTPVTCTATDAAGNVGTRTFNITVVADQAVQPVPPVVPPVPNPGTATATVGPGSALPAPPVEVPNKIDDPIAPLPASPVANFFRIDHIKNDGGPVVDHFGDIHSTPDFAVIGKLADAPAQSFLLSSGTDFGAIQLNTPSTQTIVIRNGGSHALDLGAVTLSGATEFSIVSKACENAVVTPAPRPLVVTAGQSCTVVVRFLPTAVGARTTTLQLDDKDTPLTPHFVTLTGAGTLAQISVGVQGLAFGDQTLSTVSPAQVVPVSNPGGSDLHVTGVSFTGAAAGDYTATPSGCAVVAAGSGCNVVVAFTPSALGVRNATLQITSDVGVKTVPVSGNGVPQPTGVAAVLTPPAPTPIPPAGGKPKLKISKLTVTKTVRRSKVRKHGVRFVLRLASGTKVVRIRILRETAHSSKEILIAFRTPGKSSLLRVAFTSRSQRRLESVLGKYQVQVTPGRSRTSLGVTTSATYKVIRG